MRKILQKAFILKCLITFIVVTKPKYPKLKKSLCDVSLRQMTTILRIRTAISAHNKN